MPDSAAIIGKIAVKVIPDTDNFKEELKKQLNSIEKELKAEGYSVKIPVELDGSKIKADAKKAREDAQRELKDITLRVNVDDQDSLKANIARIQAELKKLDEKQIQVKLNREDLTEKLKEWQDKLSEIQTITLRVDKHDMKDVEQAIAKIDAELKELGREPVPIKLDEAHLRHAREQFQALLDDANARAQAAADKQLQDSIKRSALTVKEVNAALNDIQWAPGLDKVKLEETKREIEAALFKLADLKKQVELEVDPIAKRKLEMELAALQARIANMKAKVSPVVDDDAMRESIQMSQLMVNRINGVLSDVSWAPKVDKARLAAAQREIEAALYKIEELSAKINVEVDPASKRKLEAEMEALQAKVTDVKVKLNAEVDKAAAAKTKAQLEWLGKAREVDFKPVVNNRAVKAVAAAMDRLSGWRQGRAFVDDLKEMLFNLDLAIPKITTTALGIGGLGLAATQASMYLFALSSALAQIGAGLALALPGAFVALGIAVGTAIMALKDFKKVLPDVVAQYKTLQKTVSHNFWAKAEAPLRKMATELFPAIQKGMSGVATSLGTFFGKFSDSLRTILGPHLGYMFEQVSKGIDSLSEHTDAFATILTILGKVGSKFFADMMAALGDAADGWAEWLTEAEKTGKLQDMIDKAVKGIKNLWSIGGDLLGVFNGIADAAERALGEDVLTRMARGLDKLHAIVDSDAFQKNLTGVFVAARAAMHNISELAGPALEKALENLAHLVRDVFPDIGSTIGNILGGIGDAFNNPRLRSGVRTFFESLAKAAETMRPAFESVGGAIGAVLDLLATFIEVSAPYAAEALESISGWVKKLADGFKPLVEKLVPAVGDLFDAISPSIDKFVKAISDFASGKGGQAIVNFVKDITPGVKKLAEFFSDLAVAVIQWLDANAADILETWSRWFNNVADWVDQHKNTIIGFFEGLLEVAKFLATHIEALAVALGLLVAVKVAGWALSLGQLVVQIAAIRAALTGTAITSGLGGMTTGLAGLAGVLGRFAAFAGVAAIIAAIALAIPRSDDFNPDPLHSGADALFEFGAGAEAALGPVGLLMDLLFGTTDNPGLEDFAPPTIPDFPDYPDVEDSQGNRPNPMPKPQNGWPNLPGYIPDEQFADAIKRWENWNGMYQDFLDGLVKDGDEQTDAMTRSFGQLFEGLQGHFSDDFPPMGGSWKDFWDGLERDLTDQFGPDIAHQLRTMFEGMQGDLDKWGEAFGGDWTSIWDALIADQNANTDQFAPQLNIDLAAMQQNLGAFAPQFTTQFASMWTQANEIGGTQGDAMKRALQQMLTDMGLSTDTGMTSLNGVWRNQWNQLPGGMGYGINSAVLMAGGIGPRIAAGVGPLGGTLYGSGQQLMDGLALGIESRVKSVVKAATLAAAAAAQAVRNKAEIASPSKVFHQIGAFMIDGLVRGLETNAAKVYSSMAGITDELINTPNTGVGGARMSGLVNSAMLPTAGTQYNRTLNYYAAPGSSLSAEEDLFAAAGRSRMGAF